MRLPKGGLIAAAFMLAGCASADLIPRQDYSSDVSKPTVSKALTFRQATSQNLGWTYKQGATAKDLTGATLITFTYVPYDRAWSQVVTGALDVATNGSVLVTFTPAQLNTNSGARPFDWLLEVSDGTYVLGYSYGKLTLLADPTSGVTNTFPTATTAVDWMDIAAYSNTELFGPVRPGTGITSTDNADGSITLSTSGGTDTTFTNYLAGDTEIVVTGDARSGSNVLSIASTITRDTELAAYLPLAGGTMVGELSMGGSDISSIAYLRSGTGDYIWSDIMGGGWQARSASQTGTVAVVVIGTTFPEHAAGRLYYHSTSNKLFCSDGSAWNALW